MADVVCIGEILIDLVPTITGQDLARAELFVKAAGGAPANVAVGLARLGVGAAFLGSVGDDGFGRFLAATLASERVNIGGLRTTAAAPTALAVVSLAADGDRDFLFYGHPAAHTSFEAGDIDEGTIASAKILHFGSIGLIGGPLRDATLHAVALARRWGLRISFDPNLRLPLWPDAASAREGMELGLSLANIVKIGADELAFLRNDSCDLVEGVRALWHPDLQVVAVTRGAAGALWLHRSTHGEQPGFPVAAVDGTGAGDAFTAGLLSRLVGCNDPTPADIRSAVRFASAAGALATTRRGAIPSMPTRAAVFGFLVDHGEAERRTL